jgi:hypothetical protein
MTKEGLLRELRHLNPKLSNEYAFICREWCSKECPMQKVKAENCELFRLKIRDQQKAIQIIKNSIEEDKKLEHLENLK